MSDNAAIPLEIDGAALLDTPCRVCGASGPHAEYTAVEMMFGFRDAFHYVECAHCGCLQLKDIPQEIGKYYPTDYYAHTTSPERSFTNRVRAGSLRAKARYSIYDRGILGKLLFHRVPAYDLYSLRRLRPHLDTSILDVGCGNGRLLYMLREIGFRNLLGIDPFIAADLSYDNGLRVEKRFLADLSGQWDIIMFHHAFEHMDNPLETLLQVRSLLKPSGECIIRIPKASSYAWRHYRTDWVQLDAPRHIFLHTPASIERLARDAGLRTIAIADDSTEFQFMGSELYRRGIPHKDYSRRYHEFFSNSQIRTFRAQSKLLNSVGDGDSAAFYLAHA